MSDGADSELEDAIRERVEEDIRQRKTARKLDDSTTTTSGPSTPNSDSEPQNEAGDRRDDGGHRSAQSGAELDAGGMDTTAVKAGRSASHDGAKPNTDRRILMKEEIQQEVASELQERCPSRKSNTSGKPQDVERPDLPDAGPDAVAATNGSRAEEESAEKPEKRFPGGRAGVKNGKKKRKPGSAVTPAVARKLQDAVKANEKYKRQIREEKARIDTHFRRRKVFMHALIPAAATILLAIWLAFRSGDRDGVQPPAPGRDASAGTISYHGVSRAAAALLVRGDYQGALVVYERRAAAFPGDRDKCERQIQFIKENYSKLAQSEIWRDFADEIRAFRRHRVPDRMQEAVYRLTEFKAVHTAYERLANAVILDIALEYYELTQSFPRTRRSHDMSVPGESDEAVKGFGEEYDWDDEPVNIDPDAADPAPDEL